MGSISGNTGSYRRGAYGSVSAGHTYGAGQRLWRNGGYDGQCDYAVLCAALYGCALLPVRHDGYTYLLYRGLPGQSVRAGISAPAVAGPYLGQPATRRKNSEVNAGAC